MTKKYKVMAGVHVDTDPVNPTNPDGSKRDKIYKTGETFYSDKDMLQLNGKDPNMMRKFEVVLEDEPPAYTNLQTTGAPPPPSQKSMGPPPSLAGTPAPKDAKEYMAALEKMKVEELKAHAAEEEIDLKGAQTKEAILRAMRDSLSTPPKP